MYDGTLTSPQVADIHRVRDDWMQTAMSTDRADRPATEAAVAAAYRAAGLEPPALVVWMDSPLGGAYAVTALRTLAKDGQLGDQLRDRLWGQFGGQLAGQLRDQLGGQLAGQLGGQLGGQLWDQLGANLDPWGDAYWLAYYRTALAAAGLPASERLDTIAAVTASAGWWWPMAGAVVLTERPTVLHVDPQVRMHCDDGPALAYADGYTLHSWHGVTVPADLIEEGWTTDRILREDNTEIRRCALHRLGWPAFIAQAGLEQHGATVDDPGNPGHTLALYDVPARIYDEPVKVLVCDNATPERDGQRRTFGLTVPASITDPVAAAGWTFGLGPAEYRELVRAT